MCREAAWSVRVGHVMRGQGTREYYVPIAIIAPNAASPLVTRALPLLLLLLTAANRCCVCS